jgi:uncharacterized protein YkwD
MGTVLIVAAVWLFLVVLAIGILRTAGTAERDAERRLRERRVSRPRSSPAATARRAGRAAVVVAAVPLAGAAVGARAADAAICQSARDGSQLTAPRATLCLINHERTRRGLAPLTGNAQLGRAASRHAADMVHRGYFSHTTPEGVGFATRLRRAGYMHGCSSWTVGETLAWGYGTEASAASRVAAWMHSPPHRAILLGASYREAGIAVLKGSPGQGAAGFTYVGEFGRRRC